MYKKTLFNIPRIKFVMKRRPYLVFLIGSQIILRSTSDNFACDLLHYSNLVLLKYDKYFRKSEPISEESDALVFKIPTIAFFSFSCVHYEKLCSKCKTAVHKSSSAIPGMEILYVILRESMLCSIEVSM